MAENGPKIIVVGCGVIGLSTAVCIQKTVPNAEVVIVADAFYKDITSYGAAGMIRITSFKSGYTPDEETGRKWFSDTYLFCQRLFQSSEANQTGITRVSGYFLFGDDEENMNTETYEGLTNEIYDLSLEDVRRITPYTHITKGTLFTTFVADPTHLLIYLKNKFLKNGGRIEKRTVKSLAEFVGKCDVVVNCSGLRAQQLVGDKTIYGVKGQVFKLKAPWIKNFYYHGPNTYIIPGIDGLTVGGTRQISEPATEINQYDSLKIMEKAVKIVPSLKNAEVIKQWVGLRPTRQPIRVEKETLKFGNKEVKVVHNYGHGGYGVTLSWGTARHATELVLDHLNGMGISKATQASIPSSL